MKNIKIIYAIALLIIGFAACKKDDPAPNPEGIQGPANDTIQVDYNGTVDLSALFSIEPVGAVGTLSYSNLQQPQQKEVDNNWEAVNAYSLSGSVLTSTDVRVPDKFYADNARRRDVTEGTIKVSIQGNTAISEKTVVIVQKNKPVLTPTITLADESLYTDVPDGKLLTLKTSGSPKYIYSTTFKVAPIDFAPENIRVRPQPESSYINAPSPTNPATSAGGRDGDVGEGDYVIAFYCESTVQTDIDAALAQAVAGTIPFAKLYVNVEAVVPADVVGIEVDTEALGTKGRASFWRNNANGRQVPSGFIKVKLSNGDIEPYDASAHAIELLAGEFDEHLEGRSLEDPDHPGWWSHVSLKAGDLPPVGTEVSFTVSRKGAAYISKPEWTARITTNTVSSNPG